MLRFLFPKQPIFTDKFKELIVHIKEISQIFLDLSGNFSNIVELAGRAEEVEHRADRVTQGIINDLNSTFLTPFDREDIHSLAHEMDDIADFLEHTIKTIQILKLTQSRPEARQFAGLIVESAEILDALVLESFDKQKHTQLAAQYIRIIHELEYKGDLLFEKALGDLFAQETDPVMIIKWKDIFENLENVMDKFQTVSDVLESIIVKSS